MINDLNFLFAWANGASAAFAAEKYPAMKTKTTTIAENNGDNTPMLPWNPAPSICQSTIRTIAAACMAAKS